MVRGYRLLYGSETLHDPAEGVFALDCVCVPSLVKPGSLKFSLPPTHPMLGRIGLLQKRDEVALLDGDDEVFRGRAMRKSVAFDLTETYECEGNLAYLNDVQLRPYDLADAGMPKTPGAYFNWMIASYNERVDARYRVHVGVNEADRIQGTIYRSSSNLVSVRQELKDKMLDSLGGYVRMRYDGDLWYVDYLADAGEESAQRVEFGVNLTDYMRESSAYERFTAVVPVGDDGEGGRVYIASLPDGEAFDGIRKEADRLIDERAAEEYGIVERVLECEAALPANVLANGVDFLRGNALGDTLVIKAVDRHLIDAGVGRIREGDYLRVVSDPHGVDAYFPCLERTLHVSDPGQDDYTLGTPASALTSAQAARITTLNAGINKTYDKATGASQEAKDAAVKADEAKDAADVAQSDAGLANAAASEAQKRADAAKTAAESAAAEAIDAKAAAADADAKATLAQTSATEAKSAADAANEAAGVSGAAANAAQEAAGAAQATADAAATKAGQVAAETAAVERELASVKQDALDLGTDLNGKIDSVTSTMSADYAKKTELSTTEASLKSEITKSAAEIQQTVSETYAKTTDVEGNIATAKADLQTQITQNAGLISSTATAVESAQVDATAAQAKANSASTAASAAQSTANTAKSNAATAQSTADTAKANAATAQSAANKAQADATAAATAASAASTAAERAKADAIAAAGAYADSVAETLQGQIDGAIETWSGTVAPTATNAPAKDWTTADARAKHVGDLYYDTATGYAYRYSTTYIWTLIKDTDVTKAIADAAAAQSAADAAKASANKAQSTANTAKTNAATAQTAANNAQGTANTAKTNAANAQASADTAQAAADGAQADVDALGTRVTTAETAITQSAEQIALKANKTDVYAKGDTYSKTQADAAIKVSADSITSTVSKTYATQTSLATTDTKAANAASAASTAQSTANTAKTNAATAQSTADTAKANASTAQTGVNGLTTRMTAAESSITQQADSIALRATKTEVATAKSEAVSAAATDATTKANNAKSAAVSAAASDATTKANNALASAKTYADAQIKVSADSITSTVSTTYATKTALSATDTKAANAASVASTAQSTANTAKTNAETAQSTANTAKSAIDNLEVGGRNYAVGTNTASARWHWSMQTGGFSRTSVKIDGVTAVKLTRDTVAQAGYSIIKFFDINQKMYEPTTYYTVSFDILATVAGRFFASILLGDSTGRFTSAVETNSFAPNVWTKIKATLKTFDELPEPTSQMLCLTSMNSTTGVSYTFKNLKIEKGNKATDWTPAPEDVETRIVSAESSITQLSNSITANVTETTNLGTRMSTVEQTSSGLTVRLGTAEGNITTAQNTANTAKTNAATAQSTANTAKSTANTAKADAATAQTTANTARAEAAAAAKTATSVAEITTDGVTFGNKLSGVWSGFRSRMAAGAFQVLDTLGTVVASYGADLIELGKDSTSAVIKMCKGIGTMTARTGESRDVFGINYDTNAGNSLFVDTVIGGYNTSLVGTVASVRGGIETILGTSGNSTRIFGTTYVNNQFLADFPVAQGTSGEWTYRKWASGVAECWCAHYTEVQINIAWSNGWHRSDFYSNLAFPFTFAAVPSVIRTCRTSNASYYGDGNFVCSYKPATKTTTGLMFFGRNGESPGGCLMYLDHYVVGRWK